jgi:hypothetical protein
LGGTEAIPLHPKNQKKKKEQKRKKKGKDKVKGRNSELN